jgi:hypothetical protein
MGCQPCPLSNSPAVSKVTQSSDNMILNGCSGSFARCLLSVTSGRYIRNLICLTQQEVNNQSSSIKCNRCSVCTTTPFAPSAPSPNGLSVSTVCDRAGTSSRCNPNRVIPDRPGGTWTCRPRHPGPAYECHSAPLQASHQLPYGGPHQ